jgi:hypothetical protein
MEELSYIERLIYTEVAAIMTQNHVTDRGGLYTKVTKSIWNGDQFLQVLVHLHLLLHGSDTID